MSATARYRGGERPPLPIERMAVLWWRGLSEKQRAQHLRYVASAVRSGRLS